MIRSYETYITMLGDCNHHVSYWWTTKRKKVPVAVGITVHESIWNDTTIGTGTSPGLIYWNSIVRGANGRPIMIGWWWLPHTIRRHWHHCRLKLPGYWSIYDKYWWKHIPYRPVPMVDHKYSSILCYNNIMYFSVKKPIHIPGHVHLDCFMNGRGWNYIQTFLWINVHTVAWLYI